jgi:16S rRNA (guanine527-N7)-methyltransferase
MVSPTAIQEASLALVESDLAQAIPEANRSALAAEWTRLCALAMTWNRKMDLTAARTPAAFVEIFCVDALVLAQMLPPNARVLDVGSGAGGPAIALALARPDLKLTLLEPTQKRIAFMRMALHELGREDVTLVSSTLDQALGSSKLAPPYDVAMARATFEPEEWFARARELVDGGAIAIFLSQEKTPTVEGWQATERSYVTPAGKSRRIALLQK